MQGDTCKGIHISLRAAVQFHFHILIAILLFIRVREKKRRFLSLRLRDILHTIHKLRAHERAYDGVHVKDLKKIYDDCNSRLLQTTAFGPIKKE